MNRAWLAPWAVGMGLLLGGLWLATAWLATPCVVLGESMLPTLEPGDRVLVDRWTYRQRRPIGGELVLVALEPGAPPLVKRVARTDPRGTGLGGLWLLGDNPRASLDSRRVGPVGLETVLGRVRWRYWPPARAGCLR